MKACIAGIYEHPTRKAPDKSVAQLHAEVMNGALADAGLSEEGRRLLLRRRRAGAISTVDYLRASRCATSIRPRRAARPTSCTSRTRPQYRRRTLQRRADHARGPSARGSSGTQPRNYGANAPDAAFEAPYGAATVNMYAMVAMRHMHEFGTTSEQLAWIKVAASHHAQHNPHAMLRDAVAVKGCSTRR